MLFLQGHTQPVDQVFFSPDGALLLSVAFGGAMRLWDLSSRQPRPWQLGQGLERPEIPVGAAAFVPNSRKLVVTDNDDGWVYVIDVNTGAVQQVAPKHDPPGCFTFSRGGTRCVRYGWSGEKDAPTLEWWKYPSWKCYRTWDIFADESEQFASLAFSPDDRTLAGINGSGVDLYDVATGRRRAHHPLKLGQQRPLLLFHPDGRHLAVGWGKRMTILELESMQGIAELKLASKSFVGAAFTPDGRLLLTAGNDETVKLWETATWRQTREHAWGIGAALCVAVAPDGLTAAAGGKSGTIIVWDLDY
jgi:WD40 repeat protein